MRAINDIEPIAFILIKTMIQVNLPTYYYFFRIYSAFHKENEDSEQSF
jgi:hypothetical protein